MYCPNCGKLFSERDESCRRCGLPLELAKELDSLSKPETLDEETEERFHEIWERGRARYVGNWPFQESPGFFGAIKNCFVKFWSVDTRASRSEAWYWTLFLILLSALYTIPATYMISAPPMKIIDGEPMENGKAIMKAGLMTLTIGGCVMKILWLPTAAMWMRRFHDLNWSASIALALCVVDLALGSRFASKLFPTPQSFGAASLEDAIKHIGTLTLLAINFKAGVREFNDFGPPFKRRGKSKSDAAQISEESAEIS